MAKHTQTIRRQFADKRFECVLPICGIGTYLPLPQYSLYSATEP